MKKFIDKIKKVAIGIGIAIISIPNKILAAGFTDDPIVPLYGVPSEIIGPRPAYGVPASKLYEKREFWSCLQILIIPVLLIIGLIVYFRKKKKSEEKVSKKPIVISLIVGILLFIIIGIISKMFIN